jgi:hypothetical protein
MQLVHSLNRAPGEQGVEGGGEGGGGGGHSVSGIFLSVPFNSSLMYMVCG